MRVLVGCSITLRRTPMDADDFVVQLRHYEELKDRLDRKETGLIELDSVHGDGKLLCFLEDIRSLFYAGQSFATDREAWEAVNKLDVE